MMADNARRGIWAVVFGVALSLHATQANGQTNYQSYPIGGRAVGMGGAYTALADDAPGAFYNPAGIAWAEGDSLSLSASLYGLVGGREKGALGPGLDYTYSSVNIVPSATSSVLHIGHGTADHPSPWVFGFNVFAPENYAIDQPTTANSGQTTLFNIITAQTLLLGPTLAWRMNSRVSFGLSLYGVYRSLSIGQDFTDTFPSSTGAINNFDQITDNLDQTSIGLMVGAGLRVRLNDDVYIGLSLRSPSGQVYGSGKSFARVVVAATSAGMAPTIQAISTNNASTDYVMPFRGAFGMAWSRRGYFTLSLDTTFYAPTNYTQVSSNTNPAVDMIISHSMVFDVALGAEIYVRPTIPIMLGVFTDLSGAPTPSVTGSTEDQVNLFGATLGSGWKSAHTETLLSLVGDYGWTRTLGIDVVTGSYQQFAVTGTQYRVYLNFAGTYSF